MSTGFDLTSSYRPSSAQAKAVGDLVRMIGSETVIRHCLASLDLVRHSQWQILLSRLNVLLS